MIEGGYLTQAARAHASRQDQRSKHDKASRRPVMFYSQGYP